MLRYNRFESNSHLSGIALPSNPRSSSELKIQRELDLAVSGSGNYLLWFVGKADR